MASCSDPIHESGSHPRPNPSGPREARHVQGAREAQASPNLSVDIASHCLALLDVALQCLAMRAIS
eukprot:3807753-Pyramimonas_sp.AAC.1